MSEFIHLIGSEDVLRAASEMTNAASEIQRAASSISGSVELLVRALEQHGALVQELVEQIRKAERARIKEAVRVAIQGTMPKTPAEWNMLQARALRAIEEASGG